MERARDVASHASHTTRGHILQLLTYTYGDTGQEEAFERTISEATDLLAFSGEGIDTVQKEFIPFEVYEIRGKINRDLGKPLNALPYLELAEKSLNAAQIPLLLVGTHSWKSAEHRRTVMRVKLLRVLNWLVKVLLWRTNVVHRTR